MTVNLNEVLTHALFVISIVNISDNKYSNIKNLSVDEILENILNVEIGLTFSRVLEDAGVFKRDEKGKNAFLKFINHIGGRF